MAKHKRPRAGVSNTSITKDEAQDIGKKAVSIKPKKAPSVRFGMRIPHQINKRLEAVMEKTGLAKAAIILRGLNRELDEMEQ